MRRRLYYLLPSALETKQLIDKLLLARIDILHLHVLAREGVDLEDLPEANLFQKSDVVHGWEMGLVIGGLTGTLAGIGAYLYPPTSMEPGGMMVLAVAIAGAFIGSWASSMIAVDVPNSQLSRFLPQIDKGDVLLMADVPKERVHEIEDMIKETHPLAHGHGIEPTMPAFP